MPDRPAASDYSLTHDSELKQSGTTAAPETVADLIRELSWLEAKLPITQLPGFLQTIPIVAAASALVLFMNSHSQNGHSIIHVVYALAALVYALAYLKSKDSGRYCVHIVASTVPFLDVVLCLTISPPTVAQLDAFFGLRDMTALISICVGMVLGWHNLPDAGIRTLSAMACAWTCVWWRSGDVRPLTLYFPIILAPGLMGYAIMNFATAAHLADEKVRKIGERLEEARRREIQQERLHQMSQAIGKNNESTNDSWFAGARGSPRPSKRETRGPSMREAR